MKKNVEMNHVSISFKMDKQVIHAVHDVSFALHEKETIAIVGESGCGKSVLTKSIMKLNNPNTVHYEQGSVIVDGKDVIPLKEKEMQSVRAKVASMVFQNPMSSLNPTMKIEKQVAEAISIHRRLSKEEVDQEVLRLLTLVQLKEPEKRRKQYPHQLSGGMKQRVMIAMALACQPKVLLLDEPTTALDVTIQAQIMKLIMDLRESLQMSIILITHDLHVAQHFADTIMVMYAGEIVEKGKANTIFTNPKHPYTKALLGCQIDSTYDKQKPLSYLSGMPTSLSQKSRGCAFAPRCEECMQICLEEKPILVSDEKQEVTCFLYHPDRVEKEEEHA